MEEALSSILRQKSKYSYEVIVSDDASQDESLTIARKFLGAYPDRMRLLTNPQNRGCLSNTLSCYEQVTSRYFTVLDPDDLWASDSFIEAALDFLESNEEYTIFMGNTLIEQGGQRQSYISGSSRGFDFSRLDEAVPGHTSATVFRNCGALQSSLNTLRSKIGTREERVYEGDSFRNLLHLSQGRGYFDETVRSVYRITKGGIWAGQSQFTSRAMNALLFVEMHSFFEGRNSEYFLHQASAYGKYTFDWLDEGSENLAAAEQLAFYRTYLAITAANNRSAEEDQREAFVFYLPSRTLGGYETLLTRIARSLAEDLHCVVYFVDFANGVPRGLLAGSAVKMIDYTEGNAELRIGRPYTMVVPTTLGLEMPHIVDPDVRILSWWAHPKSFEWLRWRAQASHERAKEHIDRLEASKALMFMDWACWKAAERALSTPYTKNYVPVFAPLKHARRTGPLHDPRVVNAAWLGRLDDDKAPAVEMLIKNLELICKDHPIRLHVIGDGNSRERLEALSRDLPFDVIFLGTLFEEVLNEYLTSNVDVMFAMGISSLEAANIGLPTIFTAIPVDDCLFDGYCWLYDLSQFTLGLYVPDLVDADLNMRPLADLLSELKAPNAISSLGKKCLDYSASQHSEPLVLCRLLRASRAAGPNADVILAEEVPPTPVPQASPDARTVPEPPSTVTEAPDAASRDQDWHESDMQAHLAVKEASPGLVVRIRRFVARLSRH